MICRRNRRQRIQPIVLTGHREREIAKALTTKVNPRMINKIPALLYAKKLALAPAAHRQRFGQLGISAIADDASARRYCTYDVMKLATDRRNIGKDIGVIVFEIIEYQRTWPVVHELAALVEERGVVFIGFDHERRHRLIPVTGACGDAEILRDTTD